MCTNVLISNPGYIVYNIYGWKDAIFLYNDDVSSL